MDVELAEIESVRKGLAMGLSYHDDDGKPHVVSAEKATLREVAEAAQESAMETATALEHILKVVGEICREQRRIENHRHDFTRALSGKPEL